MKKIDTLSSIDGRRLLYKIFHELRYEKQLPSRSVLALCWRLCTQEREIFRFVKQEAIVSHPLGIVAGTALWMEEIVNRFYFSTVNSFVYLGAALLLVLIGIRRFSDNVSDGVVIAGIVFEALMLVFMFVVMIFTPNEDIEELNRRENPGRKSAFLQLVKDYDYLPSRGLPNVDLYKGVIDDYANMLQFVIMDIYLVYPPLRNETGTL